MKKVVLLLKGLRISPNFREKLIQNFHGLTSLERLVYLLFIRPFWSADRRFFFEGSLGLLGQMYVAERRALYETIVEKRPRHCFEIGTYTGGGSTYFIAKAFEKIGAGKMYTLEIDPYYHNKASTYFRTHLPSTNKYVEFILGSSADKFNSTIASYGNSIDCVFLDGAEDGDQTLDQYNFFLPYFHPGTILMAHDWNTEKTRSLRPLIENDPKWKVLKRIDPPQSVGMIAVERI